MILLASKAYRETEVEIQCGARTNPGRVRENNEDSFALAPEINLFVLSDGMGGYASGEVASRLATETIIAHCRGAENDPALPLSGGTTEGDSRISTRLARAIHVANSAIRRAAKQDPAQQGMGATVVAVRFADDRMTVAHVGDSRAYRLRGGELDQLTQDHSFVAEQVRRGIITEQEAARSNMQSVLLRALGSDDAVQADVTEALFLEGDTILLCTDGLSRELSDAQIAGILRETEEPQEAADRLVDLANQAGGEDNITAIVLRRAAKPGGAFARIGKWFKHPENPS